MKNFTRLKADEFLSKTYKFLIKISLFAIPNYKVILLIIPILLFTF